MADIATQGQNAVGRVKSSFFGSLALSAGMSALAHPVTYIKVLIQIGHEPIAPVPHKTFFGHKVLRLPNFIQYAGHIKSVDGWTGLYRGLGPRFAQNIVSSAITNSMTNKLDLQKEEETDKTPVAFLRETGNLALAKTCGVVVSYPFHVISIRMMVQFVGRETYYSNIFSSVKEIYQEEGILGFFSGLIPHLMGELIALWMFRTINYLAQKYVLQDAFSKKEVKTYTTAVSQYIASMLTYPFQLVTTLMTVNDTRLKAGNPPLMPIYESWTECWIELGKKGLRSRGSTLFRRNVIA